VTRAPTQYTLNPAKPAGTISWEEHCEAYAAYHAEHGGWQSADRIAQRGGFCYAELVEFLGREPATWRPR